MTELTHLEETALALVKMTTFERVYSALVGTEGVTDHHISELFILIMEAKHMDGLTLARKRYREILESLPDEIPLSCETAGWALNE